jgi:hypothetical protein
MTALIPPLTFYLFLVAFSLWILTLERLGSRVEYSTNCDTIAGLCHLANLIVEHLTD